MSHYNAYFKETLELLKPKQREEVLELCHKADMELARVSLDEGMIPGFFYDCINGGIQRVMKKPKHYVILSMIFT